jgi:archaemetzincin
VGRRLGAAAVQGDAHDSDALLDALIARADAERVDPREAWLLVVSGGELRAPGYGRVFGEAAVGAGCAVVGLAPLDAGSRCTAKTLMERAVKVCVHEIGHAAGLEHCADRACVMYPSRDIADVDRKDKRFCRRCAKDLQHATLDAART